MLFSPLPNAPPNGGAIWQCSPQNKIVRKEEHHILEYSNTESQNPTPNVDFCSHRISVFPDHFLYFCCGFPLSPTHISGIHSYLSWQLKPCLESSSPPGHWAISLSPITRNALQFPPLLIPEMKVELTISFQVSMLNSVVTFCDAFIWIATQWHILDHVWSFFPILYSCAW